MAWKNYPLPFHNNAEPAAEAAMAADAQGKFWQMHDKLFANNTALDRASLEKYAQELGLDMAKFKADLDARSTRRASRPTPRKGQAVGVERHAGRLHQRPQDHRRLPVGDLQEVADEELAKVDSANRKGKKTVAGQAR